MTYRKRFRIVIPPRAAPRPPKTDGTWRLPTNSLRGVVAFIYEQVEFHRRHRNDFCHTGVFYHDFCTSYYQWPLRFYIYSLDANAISKYPFGMPCWKIR